VIDPNERILASAIKDHRWYPKNKETRPANKTLKRVSSSGALALSHSSNPASDPSQRPPTSPNLNQDPKNRSQSQKKSPIVKKSPLAPPLANAFEIIGWSGIFDLSRILIQAMGPTSIKANRKTQYVTEETDLHRFVKSIENAYTNLNQENNAFTFKFDSLKTRAKVYDEEGLSGFIQIYTLAPQLYLIDFVQEEGNTDDWYKMFRSVYKSTKMAE